MTIPGATFGSRYLCFQKALVFVNGGAADVADSCQFADVQLPAHSVHPIRCVRTG